MNTLILKFGGSILTDKSVPFSFYPENVTKLAQDLSDYLKSHPDTQCIIVHGAGSFAHPLVKEYQLHKHFNHPEAPLGLAKTEQGVRTLNTKIVDIFQSSGLPLFALSVSSWYDDTLRIPFDLIQSVLDKDMIPTLYGDVSLLPGRDLSITSGDVLVAQTLAYSAARNSTRLILVGDTAGVLNSNNQTINQLSKNTIITQPELFGEPKGIDVTGGMRQKLIELIDQVGSGDVILTSLEGFSEALNGDYTNATQLIAE